MPKTANGNGNLEVLVVEDDRFLRKILTAKFESVGFAVRGAADGEEALKEAFAKVPAFVLLDLILPKINGFEVLAALKTDKRTKGVPVIVLSNLGQQEDVNRAKSLGAEEFLIKSNHSMEEIVGMVREAYAKHLAKT